MAKWWLNLYICMKKTNKGNKGGFGDSLLTASLKRNFKTSETSKQSNKLTMNRKIVAAVDVQTR